MMPYHQPQTGLQAKYSIEYDLVAIALDGRAGMSQYTDAAVQRPQAQDLMRRVRYVPVTPEAGQVVLNSRVVLRLTNGDEFEETVSQSHGTPGDPLTRDELLGKFHECAQAVLPAPQRDRLIGLCEQLDSLDTLGEIGNVVGNIQEASVV
jgi:2-methylcitrate dehydratase PrpD